MPPATARSLSPSPRPRRRVVRRAALGAAGALAALGAAFACRPATLAVRWVAPPRVRLDSLAVSVTTALGSRQATTVPGDAQHGGVVVSALRTLPTGRAVVTFRLAAGGATSAGRIELPLRGDWARVVTIHVDSTDPRRTCMGCEGSRGFPLAFPLTGGAPRLPADSVWIVWGGNSIRRPVVY